MGPAGDKSAKAEHGSIMVGRAACLMRLMAASRNDSILETPGTSVMPLHPKMAETINMLNLKMSKICMGNFGGPSKKDMHFWSQADWVPPLGSKHD